jgi:PAS domain-containing protein
MNQYLLISQITGLLLFIFSSLLGCFVLFQNPQKRLNQVYFVYSLFVAIIGFSEFMLRASVLPTAALFWYKLIWVGSLGLPGSILHFSLLITGSARATTRFFQFVISHIFYLPLVAILLGTNLIITDVAMRYYGFGAVRGLLYHLGVIYSAVYPTAAFIIFFRSYLVAATMQARKQRFYLFCGVLIQLVLAAGIQVILPAFKIIFLPFGSLYMIFGLIFMAIAIVKYELMTLTPQNAATAIVSAMADCLLLINPTGNIIATNDAAVKLLGYRTEELIGMSINHLVSTQTAQELNVGQAPAKSFKGELILQSKEQLPAGFRSTAVKNQFGELIGSAVVFHDFREINKLIGELETAKTILEETVKQRTAKLLKEKNSLEATVKERFKEIAAQMEQLRIFHDTTVERELKMITLEKEINHLLSKLGKRPKY